MKKFLLEVTIKSSLFIIIPLGLILTWPNLSNLPHSTANVLGLNTATPSSSLEQNSPSTGENPPNNQNVSFDTDEFTFKVDPTGKFIEDQLTVKFKDKNVEKSAGVQNSLKSHSARYIYKDLNVGGYKQIKVNPQKREELKKLLENDPNVESVEQVPTVHLNAGWGGGGGGGSGCWLQANELCGSGGSDRQWAIRHVQAPQAWMVEKADNGYPPSSDVTIAVIDTGVDYNHWDLKRAPMSGGKVYLGDDLVSASDNDPMDEYGHGTSVAGIAGALTNNTIGIAGAGYYAKILAMRVTPGLYGNPYLLAAGIRYSVDYYDNIKVINVSLGLDQDVGVVRDAVAYAQSRGAVIVAATKNSGPGYYSCFQGFPAAYSGVVSVIATDKYDQHASGCGGSYYNGTQYEGVWVSAPGKEIYSLMRNNNYGYLQGANTSWATPFVSGLAALLSSKPGDKCNLTPGQVKAAIKYGSRDLGSPGWDMKYGQGRVDFWDSLAYYHCT